MTKALTLHQPWASLIALGVKTIETRSWSTKYRGRLLIHAGQTYQPLHCDAPEHDHEWWSSGSRVLIPPKDAEHQEEWKHGNPFRPLPFGVIVASCTLADVVPMVDLMSGDGMPDEGRSPLLYLYPDEELILSHHFEVPVRSIDVSDQRPYGDFAAGRFAWLLEDVKPTDERCPACWGDECVECHTVPDGCTDDLLPHPHFIDCPTCDGEGRCEPVPARGRQQLWEWAP